MKLPAPLRRVYDAMPEPVKGVYRRLHRAWHRAPLSEGYAQHRWIRDEYFAFGQRSRRDVFLGIARYHHINRPMEGYYFEFGSHEANTMRMAWDTFRHLFDYTYVAFDSFEGLPEIRADRRAGDLGAGEARDRRAGVPPHLRAARHALGSAGDRQGLLRRVTE